MQKKLKNKAMIFVLDAIIGIVIAIIVLSISNIYVARTGKDALPTLHHERIASDVVRSLDYYGVLSSRDMRDSDDRDVIYYRLNEFLPNEFNMTLNITYNVASGTGTLEAVLFDDIFDKDEKEIITSGGQFVVTVDSNNDLMYTFVRYSIWPR